MDTKTINQVQPAAPSLPVTLLLRTPAFAVNAELPSVLESLKELIRTASPPFFEQIRSLSAEDLPLLKSSKIRYTLWKYFNRSKYRPVPFNGFAAVSLPDNPRAGCGRTQVEHKLTLHQFADWNVQSGQGPFSAAALLESQLMGNPTLYATGTEYRYTRFDAGQFSLAMAGQVNELSAVMDYCMARRPATAVLAFLQQHTGWRRAVALHFLLELTRHQLLWTDRHAGIIAETKPLCIDDIQASRHVTNYIIAERKMTGSDQEPDQRLLAEVARFLATHFPAPPNESLQNFSRAFTRRYELQAVPLTQVMDPQLGLGYGEAVRSARESSPPSAAAEASGKETSRSLPLTPLIMALLSRFASDPEIDLARLLPDQAGPAPLLPNTLPVIYRPFGERMVLDHMGGCTTNALLGRFSLCGPAYHHRCREIAAWEASANPGADFFDISYHAEGHADNINRRMPAYPLELSINSWPAGDSLRLEDILVTVRNGEIILLSAQSGRRLVPRMATAYNFKRSPLSVFRFLGDLQYQGLNVPMLPDLTQVFPGQPHYSRLSYRSVILFPETWMVPGGLVTGTTEDAARISHWLQQQNIDSSFRTGNGDQTLVFNPGLKEDIDMFVSYCRHHHHVPVYIAEALMDPTGRVHDEDGNLYAAQFIASVSHSAEVYPPAESAGQRLLTGVERQFPPGREWLCFEIYGHPSVTTDILRRKLKPLLTDIRHELKQWFFIRYEDQGPHLRLRLHLRQGLLAESVVQRLIWALDGYLHTGAVRDIKIVTYRRELERYGTDNMALVEAFFHADSVWVLQLLKRKLTRQQWYPYVLDMMREMISLAYPAGGEQRAFTKMMADVFAHEFSWTTADFKKFNMISLKTNCAKQRVLPVRLRRAWLALERKNLSEAQKAKLLADLLHLHINRLFDDDQRMHEGVLYQLLFTHMKKRFRSPANVTERSDKP